MAVMTGQAVIGECAALNTAWNKAVIQAVNNYNKVNQIASSNTFYNSLSLTLVMPFPCLCDKQNA